MFALAVLTLNFTALAGIVLGLLLRTSRVRDALETAYIYTSDLVIERDQNEVTRELVWAFTRTALLNANNTISLRKILVVSLISSVIFSITMAPIIGKVTPYSPIAILFGGGSFGSLAGTLAFYLIAWPGHLVYDYLICRALLRVSKSGSRRSLSRQIACMLITFLVMSFIPITVLATYLVVRLIFPGLPIEDLSLLEDVLAISFLWNGPSFFWLGIARLVIDTNFLNFMTVPNVALFLLSSIASSSIAFFDLLARSLSISRTAINFISNTALRLTKTNADHVFNASMIAFAIGNGLCQIFGISIHP